MKGPNQRPSHPTRKPKTALRKGAKPRGSRWLGLVLGLGGVALLSATAGALLAMSLVSTPLMQRELSPAEASVFSKGDRMAKNNSLQLPELTRPVNILVLGTKVLTTDIQNPPAELKNLRYQALVNSFDGLTDTMLMFRFNPAAKKLSVLSVPRDTRTLIPGYGIHKINEANVDGGPALSAKATSELLGGVGVDRYVTVNVQGVQALVDALGGVTVFVPKDMKYRDDSQHLYVNLKAGQQHLNGDQALQLLRFRYDEYGDIGRIQRQQMVMRALMEQALNPATIARLPKILSVIQSYIDTNLSVEELVALVGFAARLNRAQVQMLMVPGSFSQPGEYDASYWLPDTQRIQAMMAKHFEFGTATTEPLTSAARIVVQDSTRKLSTTQTVITKLKQAGYSNISVANPYREPLRTTRIVAQQGDWESAEAVRRSLGFGEVRIESTGDLGSDVTIQIGQDGLKNQAQ